MAIAAKCDKCKNYTNFCICGEIVNSSIEETWTKTMDFRFSIVEKRVLDSNSAFFGNATITKTIQDKILQQKHISNLGNEKWVDVESVTI